MQGVKLKNYILDEKIGSGTVGDVWRAHHRDDDSTPVAIKFLKADSLDEDQRFRYIERFIREARMTAQIEHENIVKVIEASEEGGLYFIVMEYIDGFTLSDHVKLERGRLDEKEVLQLAITICKALDEALKHQIIHRDIKPDNVLISKDGVVKLVDLGVAKQLDNDETLTLTGFTVGTPCYVAPEQAVGSASVDHRSDIYALGATLYHVLTGELPFTGKTAISILMKHVEEPLVNPQEKRSDIKDNCSSIICKMMEKNPEDRYQDYTTLLQDLRNVRDYDYPVEKLSTSGADQDETSKSESSFLVIGALVLSVIILSFLLVYI
jgi:serine/threonine protein kinase